MHLALQGFGLRVEVPLGTVVVWPPSTINQYGMLFSANRLLAVVPGIKGKTGIQKKRKYSCLRLKDLIPFF